MCCFILIYSAQRSICILCVHICKLLDSVWTYIKTSVAIIHASVSYYLGHHASKIKSYTYSYVANYVTVMLLPFTLQGDDL